MSTSGNQEHEDSSSDDDDLMDLDFLDNMSESDEEDERIPQRVAPFNGQSYTQFLMTKHPKTIRDVLRVDKQTFRSLVALLVEKGHLNWDHMRVSLEESLAIFLFICGQSGRMRLAADRFQHSLDTISRHFNLMRRALCYVGMSIIRPPNLNDTPPQILNDGRYYPWFKDCIGAIDGTHIEAWVPASKQIAFRGRKSIKTQNVMAVCSFDMKFTFVYPGWEGSAHDGRVFLAAVANPAYNFPHPPLGKYYVVDSGYTNMPGYLAPYRGKRYHRDQWNGVNTMFRSPQELFNYKHSSLRNVIERCFGVLKARFPILKSMPRYSCARQPTIVTACCVVHNWIIERRGRDEFFDGYNEHDWEWNEEETDGNGAGEHVGEVEPINMSRQNLQLMSIRRDEIAQQLWNDY
ncbi:hypothetical protein RHMOL_Rhmol01G0214800 [Rhododendron molle]|uniref:Uncharacterized protein n=2 Tax=Rhododendron molle TaxID=49168 RepID=A0ACC0Q495_RHOML|nr:hypothetical protein RHMOL_Rhmol06G0122800 [Rhododendron molle]KAI8572636.1 hypothetical protein RHMOL_Rhmol01G0214800 [Rhododendron molle]